MLNHDMSKFINGALFVLRLQAPSLYGILMTCEKPTFSYGKHRSDFTVIIDGRKVFGTAFNEAAAMMWQLSKEEKMNLIVVTGVFLGSLGTKFFTSEL